jgi:hypothetical protein
MPFSPFTTAFNGAEASGVGSTRCSASGSTSKAVIHGAEPTINDIRQHVDDTVHDTKSQFRQMNQERTKITIESTFATVRLRTKVTQGPGSRAAGIAMAYKLIESDMTGRRSVRDTWSRRPPRRRCPRPTT